MALKFKLKEIRQLQNLTQNELAESSGISIKTIQRIEKGVSTGSPYTIKTLAQTLNIDPAKLHLKNENSLNTSNLEISNTLKLLNLSSLVVLLFPLGNLILPAFLFYSNRNDESVNKYGQRILSYQLLWTLLTLLTMLVGYAILCLVYPPFRGSQVPLYVPIYIICVVINVYFTIKAAIQINKGHTILPFVPNLL